MRGGCAQRKIGSLKELQRDLESDDSLSVAIVFGNKKLYSRYKKNMGSLSELEVAINSAGYNGFFLFFEENIDLVEGFDSTVCSGYNIKFGDVTALGNIDIYLLIDLPEVANQMDFPDESKVVVFSHNLNTLAVGDANPVWKYWLTGVLSDVADYFFCPSARLKEIPHKCYESIITNYYPATVVRGKSEVCLIAGGYFNLDYSRKLMEDNGSSGKAVLIAPTASWHNPNSTYLVNMIDGLSKKFPSLEIIIRPYPGDISTFALIESNEFSDNVGVDRGGNFAEVSGKSILMISDPVSSIKASYAYSNFRPVIEYAHEVKEQIVDTDLGYCVGSIDKLMMVVEAIVNDEVVQSKWKEKLERKANETVANFGNSIECFIDIIPEIARGGSRDDWIKVAKYTGDDKLSEESLCRNIELVYKKVNNPYGIVYCYRMIREGLKRYPQSPVMHYFAAKAMAYRNTHRGFDISEQRGEYYAFILKNYHDFFEQINYELSELELIFDYVMENSEGLDTTNQDRLLSKVLEKIGSTPNGNEVVVSMLCAGLENTGSLKENYKPEEEEFVAGLEKYIVNSATDLSRELYEVVNSGLKLYPTNPVVNYYAGKILLYSGGSLFFDEGRGEGYYYNCVLTSGLEIFQRMNWKIRELVALLKYRASI